MAIELHDAPEVPDEWYKYGQKEINTILGKKKPLLNHVSVNINGRKAVGTFSIPKKKRKRFDAVTRIHYDIASDELALLFVGVLSYFKEEETSRYMSFDNYVAARKTFRCPEYSVRIKKEYLPHESFKIGMELAEVKKQNNTVFAFMDLSENLRGRLVYLYTLKAL